MMTVTSNEALAAVARALREIRTAPTDVRLTGVTFLRDEIDGGGLRHVLHGEKAWTSDGPGVETRESDWTALAAGLAHTMLGGARSDRRRDEVVDRALKDVKAVLDVDPEADVSRDLVTMAETIRFIADELGLDADVSLHGLLEDVRAAVDRLVNRVGVRAYQDAVREVASIVNFPTEDAVSHPHALVDPVWTRTNAARLLRDLNGLIAANADDVVGVVMTVELHASIGRPTTWAVDLRPVPVETVPVGPDGEQRVGITLESGGTTWGSIDPRRK